MYTYCVCNIKMRSRLCVAVQVQVLRDRISQMEMLFLQQATGVASTKLTPTAMRSLSGNRVSADVLRAIQEESEDDDGRLRSGGNSEEREYRPGIFTEDMPEMPQETGVGLQPDEIMEIMKMVHRGSDLSAFDDMSLGENSSSTQNTTQSMAAVTSLRDMKGKEVLSARQDSSSRKTSADRALSDSSHESVQQRMVTVSKQLQDAVKLSNELLDEKLLIIPRSHSEIDSTKGDVGSVNYSDSSYISRLTSRQPTVAPYVTSRDVPDDSILLDLLQLYPCDSSPSGLDSPDTDSHATSPPAGEAVCQEWVGRLFGRFTEIISVLVPSNEAVVDRLMVMNYISSVIARALGAQVFPVGSFTSRSFLPGGDLDVTAFLTSEQMDSWFVKVNEAMCISSMGEGPDCGYTLADGTFKKISVRNVSFINALVKVVKGIVNGVEVDISVNQISALYAQALVDQVDVFVGQKHLFKRSILLIKSWCKYESPRYTVIDGGAYGAREGRLSTWAIIVMTIWIFNKFGRQFEHPLQALVGFLCYFSAFEWGRYAITVAGPLSVEDLAPANDVAEFYALPRCGGFLPREILDKFRDRFSNTKNESLRRRREKASLKEEDAGSVASSGSPRNADSTPEGSEMALDMEEELRSQTGIVWCSYYRRGVVNVMDPIQPKSNCAKSVDLTGYHAITEALQRGKVELLKMCAECKRSALAASETADDESHSETIAGNIPGRDVPYVRAFMENTTARMQEMKLGGGARPSVAELDRSGYSTLSASDRQIELSMKHAELIVGGIVTPEALARLIVHIVQSRGPLPVGEIGKQLQEITGNENLSVVLKTQFKGLKKVIEGFGKIFRLGTDHPFNPLVHLCDSFMALRDEYWYSESALSELYVFDPSISPASYDKAGNTRAPLSPRRPGGEPSQEVQFAPLTKGGKSQSFKEHNDQSSFDRADVKRSGSMSSVGGIAVTKGSGKVKPKGGSKQPQGPLRGKQQHHQQQQQFYQQQQQYYQQQQQYQQYMMYQQQYQLYMQQQVDGDGDTGPTDSSHRLAPPHSPHRTVHSQGTVSYGGAYPMQPLQGGYPQYPAGYPVPVIPAAGSPETSGFYPSQMGSSPGSMPPGGGYMYYGVAAGIPPPGHRYGNVPPDRDSHHDASA